jgi:hypothetical protein
LELVIDAEVTILELDQRDVVEEYSDGGFGVGFGVDVEEAPGPSPSQLML